MISLKALYEYFVNQKESQWIMAWSNARRLHQFILEHDIKRVLDLGTGIGLSASVVALALKEKGVKYQIDSLEQYEKCIALADKIIPVDLRDGIKIHPIKYSVWSTPLIPYQYFSIYETLPEGDYDLWINDGPAPFLENGNYVELPNATVMKAVLENKLKPGTFIAYDGRIASLRTLERYFGDNFYLIKPGQGTDFNVIQRRDNEVKYEDMKLITMKEIGYFEGM